MIFAKFISHCGAKTYFINPARVVGVTRIREKNESAIDMGSGDAYYVQGTPEEVITCLTQAEVANIRQMAIQLNGQGV